MGTGGTQRAPQTWVCPRPRSSAGLPASKPSLPAQRPPWPRWAVQPAPGPRLFLPPGLMPMFWALNIGFMTTDGCAGQMTKCSNTYILRRGAGFKAHKSKSGCIFANPAVLFDAAILACSEGYGLLQRQLQAHAVLQASPVLISVVKPMPSGLIQPGTGACGWHVHNHNEHVLMTTPRRFSSAAAGQPAAAAAPVAASMPASSMPESAPSRAFQREASWEVPEAAEASAEDPGSPRSLLGLQEATQEWHMGPAEAHKPAPPPRSAPGSADCAAAVSPPVSLWAGIPGQLHLVQWLCSQHQTGPSTCR